MNRKRFLIPWILCAFFVSCGSPYTEPDREPAEVTETARRAEMSDSRETTLGPLHAVVTLANSSPVLGEQVVLTLSVDAAAGVLVTMPEFGDQLGKFGIADYRATENVRPDGRMEYIQTYTLDLPMSGKLKTPSFLVEFVDNRADSEHKGKNQELLTEEMTFEVASVFADGEAPETLYPARGVLPELVLPERDARAVWLWILLGLVVVGATAAFVFFRFRKAAEVHVPPDIIALRALDEMKAREIPSASSEIDAWYVELSSIVRTYIEGRFALNAPRLTTEEFFEVAGRSDAITGDNRVLIRRLLEHSDRVKFTDFVPDKDESASMLENARKFVVDTREVPEEAQTASPSAGQG